MVAKSAWGLPCAAAWNRGQCESANGAAVDDSIERFVVEEVHAIFIVSPPGGVHAPPGMSRSSTRLSLPTVT